MDRAAGGAVAPFIKRLEAYGPLSEDDKRAIADSGSIRHFNLANVDFEQQGDRAQAAHLISEGFACSYKQGRKGERQIMSLFLPGDICNASIRDVAKMDHSIGTLSECRTVGIAAEKLARLHDNPRIARAIRMLDRSEASRSRELTFNVGARRAVARVAHLFCEMHYRLDQVGQVDGESFKMPITQKNLSEIVGLSVVHVNRAISELKKSGLIRFKCRHLKILEVRALQERAEFETDYIDLVPY